MSNETLWWGDVEATVAYCQHTVKRLCAHYGGDPRAVLLAGFSRGAIACNIIGLHDDEIAGLWAGFVAHSHYDGQSEEWPYPEADRASARKRLRRVAKRPVWISGEDSLAELRDWVAKTLALAAS